MCSWLYERSPFIWRRKDISPGIAGI